MMVTQVTQFKSYPSPFGLGFNLLGSLSRLGLLAACLLAVGSTLKAEASFGQTSSVAPIPNSILAQSSPNPTTFPAPGTYLFGQVPEPNQIGQGYMVLESTGDRVYGALYYPSSSFDCFHGQLQGNQLAMTIINSYSQEAYPYSVALVSNTAVASGQLSNGLAPLSLSGFYGINTLSNNDLRMLAICREVVAPQP